MGFALPGLGDIAEKVCDSILPKELKIVGDLVGGYINFQTGNYAGMARQGMELFSDLNDLQQHLGKPQNQDTPGETSWSYEPPPPVFPRSVSEALKTLAESARRQISEVLSNTGAEAPPAGGWVPSPEQRTTMTNWRGSPPEAQAAKPTEPAKPAKPAKTTTPKEPKATTETKPKATTEAKPKATTETKPKATTETKPKATGSKVVEDFFKKSPDDFMKAIRDGNIPPEVMDDPTQMRRLQAKTDHISQMNQLMTSMLAALHQMRMAIIHNVRV